MIRDASRQKKAFRLDPGGAITEPVASGGPVDIARIRSSLYDTDGPSHNQKDGRVGLRR